MSVPAIAAIEMAMLARLRTVSDAGQLDFRFRTLATYPDQWEDYLDREAEIACPAAWVVFAGWDSSERVEDEDGRQWLRIIDASFGLMVADRNMRPSEQYQRHGGADVAREPGAYRILQAAIQALAGEWLEPCALVRPIEVHALRAVSPTAASDKQRMARYACELRCDFMLPIGFDPVPEALDSMHVNWDLPPHDQPIAIDGDPAVPGRQLPDDFHADATDHLTLGDTHD